MEDNGGQVRSPEGLEFLASLNLKLSTFPLRQTCQTHGLLAACGAANVTDVRNVLVKIS